MLYEIYLLTTLGNIFLLLFLFYIFVQDYRKVASTFTLGLVLFAGILLFNAIFSCPIFFAAVGPHTCAYEPYHALASTFEFFALIILTYIVTR
jgi:hypothetical protein